MAWYCVSTSFIVLCTSNSCKVFVLKLQPQLHMLLGNLGHKELSKSKLGCKSSNCLSQQSTIHIVYYLLPHSWHEIMVYPSIVGHHHIFQMLELQTKSAPKEHNTSNPSFRYLLEWNDWTPKHIKVNIQNACTNIVLYSSWYPRFQRDAVPKIEVDLLVKWNKISTFWAPKSWFSILTKIEIIFKMALENSQNIKNGFEWKK